MNQYYQTLEKIKTDFIKDVEYLSKWRRSDSKDHPDTQRNKDSARALTNLAWYLAKLPVDSDIFTIIPSAGHKNEGRFVEVLRSFGYDDPSETPHHFIERLVKKFQ